MGGQYVLDGLLDLLLDRFQIEARALLHRRELDEGFGGLAHHLLHEYKSPELVGEPVVEIQRSAQAGALEWIEPQVDQDRPIDFDRSAQPAVGADR